MPAERTNRVSLRARLSEAIPPELRSWIRTEFHRTSREKRLRRACCELARRVPRRPSMHTRFVLLSTQRSGSGHLASLLRSHPGIEMHRELLGSPMREGSRKPIPNLKQATGKEQPSTRDFYEYLSTLSERPVSTLGFKLMYRQMLSQPALLPSLRHLDFRIIHLVRTNLLDVELSLLRAKRDEAYRSTTAGSSNDTRIHVDPAAVVTALRQRERDLTEVRYCLARAKLTVVEVAHESIVADAGGSGGGPTLERLQDFLDVKHHLLTSPLQKQATRDRSEMVLNWRELTEAIQSAGFQGYLGT